MALLDKGYYFQALVSQIVDQSTDCPSCNWTTPTVFACCSRFCLHCLWRYADQSHLCPKCQSPLFRGPDHEEMPSEPERRVQPDDGSFEDMSVAQMAVYNADINDFVMEYVRFDGHRLVDDNDFSDELLLFCPSRYHDQHEGCLLEDDSCDAFCAPEWNTVLSAVERAMLELDGENILVGEIVMILYGKLMSALLYTATPIPEYTASCLSHRAFRVDVAKLAAHIALKTYRINQDIDDDMSFNSGSSEDEDQQSNGDIHMADTSSDSDF